MLKEINEAFYAAYRRKQDPRTFWNLPNETLGAAFLGLHPSSKLADTLVCHH
jgi:hypothetical protein